MGSRSNLVALVVEDDGFQRRTVARMLRSLGALQVLEARNGREGLACLQDSAGVDLIVCDLDMPEMDGMEFIRHLGSTCSTASVVISSAKDRSLAASVEKMALAYGVRLLGLMEKPATLQGLEDMMARRDCARSGGPHTPGTTPVFTHQQILDAIARRQIVPCFQPKVMIETGAVTGMEALARWHHPEVGVVLPDAFIGTLEISGGIDALTISMLECAAAACSRMHARGFRLAMSVNLSLASLTDTTMADRVTSIALASGIAPRFLTFEITETAAMTQIAPALENLARLRMRGFGLSVDDFGTGFASLQQLMRVPFTELKIDRSFVTGCTTNRGSRIILESSVEMARRLGIASVAEGVETLEEWAIVKAARCDMAQGYYIARPMNEALFADFCALNAVKTRLALVSRAAALDLSTSP